MSRFVKPWLLALTLALCLHGLLFAWLSEYDWRINGPTEETTQLEVSLLPASPVQSSGDEAPTHPRALPDKSEEPEPARQTTSQPSTKQSTASPDATAVPSTSNNAVERPTPPAPNEARRGISLADIDQLQSSVDQAPNDWKKGSLLDIGDTQLNKKQLDTAKSAFSPDFRQALREAKSLQNEYAKGVVKEHGYDITEDPDGTRYVNIKGVCWKLPEPGTYGEWQVVISGCSGQKDTFRFELNITTDILRSDMFHDLPFSVPE